MYISQMIAVQTLLNSMHSFVIQKRSYIMEATKSDGLDIQLSIELK